MAKTQVDLSGYNIAPDMLPAKPSEKTLGIYCLRMVFPAHH